jgi:malonyl-CoA O-methyltransferase
VSAREGYELWAGTWDDAGSPIVALEERYLAPWLHGLRPRCALDIGCGTGRWTTRIGALGIDGSPSMLAVASRKPGLRGRVAAGDATSLPLASAVADLVMCTLTLGHVAAWADALRELAHVLAPGGTLILTDFHPAAAAQGWRRTFKLRDRVYELENHPYSVAELQRAAPDLRLEESVDAAFDLPERELFVRAGRVELFEAARAVPAVLLTRWTRV